MSEQQTAKWEKWNSFVSLNWYDGFIEFLFRFVAKTSEPLLALGIVISAVDFLTKGALLTNDQSLTMAWAWTQAVAIEASSGVVFVYALQSFKSKDKVKGWLYLVLSVLLAVTGGAMLLLQLVANLTSVGESAMPGYLVIGLAVLRVIVSIGYVYMCRAKHIRFTDLEEVVPTAEPIVPTVPVAVPDLEEIITRMDAMYQQRMVTTIETIVERTVERVTIPMQAASKTTLEALGTTTGTVEQELGTDQEPQEEPGTDDRLLTAYRLLSTENKVTVTGLAQLAHVRKTTASKWLVEQNGKGE